MGPVELVEQIPSEQVLIQALSSSPYSFLQPPSSLHAASLASAKAYIDPLATATSEAQVQRQQIARRKRKRGQPDSNGVQNILRLKQLYLDGFSIDQVWEQARRALDASRLELERYLRTLGDHNGTTRRQIQPLKSSLKKSPAAEKNGVRFKEFEGNDVNINSTDSEDVEARELQDVEEHELRDDADKAGSEKNEVKGEANLGEDFIDSNGSYSYDEELEGFEDSGEEPTDVFVPDKNGLNDGFFSIDDFNKQADFLEQQDARGEGNGAASDEEDIDWDIDPLAKGVGSRMYDDMNEDKVEESEDEKDGPAFGNVDFNGLDTSDDDDNVSAINLEMDNPGSMENTNSIRYADFFEPPPRKPTKAGGRRCAHPETQPTPQKAKDQEADMQRTIAAVRRDIFEDDLTPDEDETPPDPEDRRSSHQKRQAALTAEIRRLESAAIQKRDWTLSGEARAADRPVNSLLEEDLEFERVGKPVPVITQEASEDIEAMIKRRILARDFDEVIRRRPSNLATGGGKDGQRRGMFELSDAKPEQSLAEVYETEHLQRTDPAAHPSKADQNLEAEHKKIEALWKDVSAKLDALSSWHYRPKPPSVEVNVVADVPTISMEDARPAGVGGDMGAESMLAPQEIYKAGESRDKAKEVITGSGLPVGRDEMTREEKLRRRRREKVRIRKSGRGLRAKNDDLSIKNTEEKRGVIQDLKKGGVKVIGRKGEIRDVEGNTLTGQQAGKGAGGYKL